MRSAGLTHAIGYSDAFGYRDAVAESERDALGRGMATDRHRAIGRDGPLHGLAGSTVADRFRAWLGRSGRRYVFSVFALDRLAAGIDAIPMEGSSVVIGVERLPNGTRRRVVVADSGAIPDAFFCGPLVAALRSRPGAELHIHLTAGDAAARGALVADLAG